MTSHRVGSGVGVAVLGTVGLGVPHDPGGKQSGGVGVGPPGVGVTVAVRVNPNVGVFVRVLVGRRVGVEVAPSVTARAIRLYPSAECPRIATREPGVTPSAAGQGGTKVISGTNGPGG
jgi:hypothetical protein